MGGQKFMLQFGYIIQVDLKKLTDAFYLLNIKQKAIFS